MFPTLDRNLDLFMLAGWKSCERSAKDFQDVFSLTDRGFHFVRVIMPP